MNRRGIILISTLFGLFALSFGVLGVRALTLGPDATQPTATELAARTTAANTLEQQIAAARAEVPPSLPPVPAAVAGAAAPPGAAPAPAPQAYEDEGGEYEEYEGEEDEDQEYEGEHEEGDDDDD